MSSKAIVSAILSLSFVQSAAFAQNAVDPVPEAQGSEEHVLQRIEGKLDKVLDTSAENKRIFVDQPLGDRRHGVELNLFRFLAWDEYDKTLSGTYSRFDLDNNVEIAFPFMYSSGRQDDNFNSYERLRGGTLESYTLDVHYRKYLGHKVDGFYLSGFSRVAHLSGELDGYWDQDSRTGNETKLGVGVGLGYRIFSESGLYWGMSVSVGRYLTGESDQFSSSDSISADIDDGSMIFDIEFFKFGYAF